MLRIGASTLSLVGSGERSIVAAWNVSQRVRGCNPVLMLKVVLSLWNGELMWRHDYATYRPNDEFIAAIEEWV